MEALEEPPVLLTPHEAIKELITSPPDSLLECNQTNGASEAGPKDGTLDGKMLVDTELLSTDAQIPSEEPCAEAQIAAESTNNACLPAGPTPDSKPEVMSVDTVTESAETGTTEDDPNKSQIEDIANLAASIQNIENNEDSQKDSSTENVIFQTEVVVEKEETVLSAMNHIIENNFDHEASNDMLHLSEGQNIELSEALRSSDVTDHAENNNCPINAQEVLNNEELLDILEGNIPDNIDKGNMPFHSEAKLALEQLSKLQVNRQTTKKSKGRTKVVKVLSPKKSNASRRNTRKQSKAVRLEEHDVPEPVKEETIATVLDHIAKDWEVDDEPDKTEETILQDTEQLLEVSGDLVTQQVVQQEVVVTTASANTTITEASPPNSTSTPDESQTQRRLSRVIKKKVPFDPDNPDTFTKGKTVVKSKEPQTVVEQPPTKKGKDDPDTFTKGKTAVKSKEPQTVVEQPPTKKGKAEHSRAASKSPVAKTQWKKPTPKANKTEKRRLTEVDKLLMDEGAVNMIYQLTPEGTGTGTGKKKNMKTKAELIKIIQNSTPETSEMKFRERKAPKAEEGEAKKILTRKQRFSVTGSVKSMSVDDFETHSADDSIIYRRHSSSSYSSTCMSPRRLSDVETGNTQRNSQPLPQTPKAKKIDVNTTTENGETTPTFISLKEKINSKLSNVLNKRKREIKTDKPMKQRKNAKTSKDEIFLYKTVVLKFDNKVAEICIKKASNPNNCYSLEVLHELEQALQIVNERTDTSLTLLTSEAGGLCSPLELRPLMDDNMEKRTGYAFEITESVKSLLTSMERHSKVLVCGVSSACEGLALCMVVLCDVAVAAEGASFCLSARRDAPPTPGLAVLTARAASISQSLARELVVLGRRLPAAEAAARGLVARTLWPARFQDELRALAGDIAAQPAHSLLLKKQLLNLALRSGVDTLQSALAAEQDLIAAYYTSVEGQEILQAYLRDDANE